MIVNLILTIYHLGSSEFHVGKEYFDGIRDNLELMPKYYPGWTMR